MRLDVGHWILGFYCNSVQHSVFNVRYPKSNVQNPKPESMDNNTQFRRFFGAALTIIGTFVILFACVAFLSDSKPVMGFSITKVESAVPFIIGMIFFLSGVSLVRES